MRRARTRWTLRRTLVVGTSTLLAAALIVTSIATVLALRSFVYDRLDEQVLGGLEFAVGPQQRGDQPGTGAGSGSAGERPDEQPGATGDDGPAPRVGSLQAVFDADGAAVSSSYTAADGTEVTPSDDQLAALAGAVAAASADPEPSTVDLGGLGPFRVAAAPTGDGGTVVSGNSLEDATATTSALTVILLSVGGVTLLIAVVGLSLLVRRNLRPLDRVAEVAQRVSGRPLSAGDVDIPERVEETDTDPVTEVGRVGASLNTLLGHVEAALTARHDSEEQLRRFIADASHELRTPLASIRGYAQLSMREAAEMTPVQHRSLERIESESQRMGALVDDLLLLARLDAGQTLRTDPVELTLLAVDAVSDAQATDTTHEWRLDVADDQISVPGDENRLRQVLANLLRNARTHTPPGTVITTSLGRDGDRAVVQVSDDGPGIDPNVRDRLFERFARGDLARNRDAGSTGLGLSIAQAITLAHGGTIEVESAPGRTVFTVRLPLGP